MSDARIVLTIDYEPNLDHYPEHITTKREAMEFDVAQMRAGEVGDLELVDYAESVDWRVEDH
ncbi:hypothetical protein FDH96_gp098 [Mycobacterium phage Rey]|uniref:Uncharacterized protein n=1 Tax=Mycobacterium phage Rey TaxID=1034115 RepID=G1D5G0_9CAUD|nr:hypothetical protein FDH96_gp098 [Mycobacterium phage Rey]AEK10009.1 hypothetical protein PBI_REY_98 [Mycobacterium phage Rey]